MDEFKSSDIFEASYLVACGLKIQRLEGEGQRKFFIFPNKRGCEELSEAYWSKKASIEPRYFVESIKSVKDLLFSQIRRDEWKEKD